MSLATRRFADDLEVDAVSYGPRHFLCLFAGDPRLFAEVAGRPVCLYRVADSANEAEAARLVAALDEATVRRLHAERGRVFAAYDAGMTAWSRSLPGSSQPVLPPLPEWPVAPAQASPFGGGA
jgi:hypothetical protein